MLHQVGVSFDLYYDAWKHKIKIKPLIDLLNAMAPDKYLVKRLSDEQVRVQPTESSIYTPPE